MHDSFFHNTPCYTQLEDFCGIKHFYESYQLIKDFKKVRLDHMGSLLLDFLCPILQFTFTFLAGNESCLRMSPITSLGKELLQINLTISKQPHAVSVHSSKNLTQVSRGDI